MKEKLVDIYIYIYITDRSMYYKLRISLFVISIHVNICEVILFMYDPIYKCCLTNYVIP